MADTVILFQDDFQSFPIGPLPFDREHSAMGEYHYSPLPGYRGQWYDPIANCNYRGPSWLVTATDGVHYMEQTRVRNPLTHGVCPVLATGEERWQDYTFTVTLRTLCSNEEAGVLFRYQTSLMHYAFFMNDNKVQFWRIEKKERTMLAEAPYEYALSISARISAVISIIRFHPPLRCNHGCGWAGPPFSRPHRPSAGWWRHGSDTAYR